MSWNNNNNNNYYYYVLPSCHSNRWYLESLGCWACPGNCQTGHISLWRTQRIHLSVSAVVNSPPNGKCGHLWLRLDAVAVMPCVVQYVKHAALSQCEKTNNCLKLSPSWPLCANAWLIPLATCTRSHNLFQRFSVIVQRFSSVLIHESFVSADEEPDL